MLDVQNSGVDSRRPGMRVRTGQRPGSQSILGQRCHSPAKDARNTAIARSRDCQCIAAAHHRSDVRQIQDSGIRGNGGRRSQRDQPAVVVRASQVHQCAVLPGRAGAAERECFVANSDATLDLQRRAARHRRSGSDRAQCSRMLDVQDSGVDGGDASVGVGCCEHLRAGTVLDQPSARSADYAAHGRGRTAEAVADRQGVAIEVDQRIAAAGEGGDRLVESADQVQVRCSNRVIQGHSRAHRSRATIRHRGRQRSGRIGVERSTVVDRRRARVGVAEVQVGNPRIHRDAAGSGDGRRAHIDDVPCQPNCGAERQGVPRRINSAGQVERGRD